MANSEENPKDETLQAELSTKELAFVLAYTCVGSTTCSQLGKSAIASGSSENNASRDASRLMKKPHVREAIKDIHQKMMDDALINPQKILNDLQNTLDLALAKGDLTAANRSIELQGKYLTMFNERVIVDTTEQHRVLSESEKEQARILAAVINRQNLEGNDGT